LWQVRRQPDLQSEKPNKFTTAQGLKVVLLFFKLSRDGHLQLDKMTTLASDPAELESVILTPDMVDIRKLWLMLRAYVLGGYFASSRRLV
jgi:hypothetical protein